MKTTGVILVIIIVLAMAHKATSKHATSTNHTPASATATAGHIAIQRDDDTMRYTATCDDHGAVVTLHPDNTTTRPAATQACRNAAHDYALLNSAAQGGR